MANSSTKDIYIKVMEDVINKVRNDFINNDGPGEAVLNQLKSLWEQKMIEAGVISGPINRSSPQNVEHDLNVSYEGTEEYETPTVDILFPQTPSPGTGGQTAMSVMRQTRLPGIDASFILNVPAGGTPIAANEYSPPTETGGVPGARVGRGMPSPFMTPLPGMGQTPMPGTDGSMLFNVPTGGALNEYSPATETGGIPGARVGRGMPSPFMQQLLATLLNQKDPLNVNAAYTEVREKDEQGPTNRLTTQVNTIGG